MGMVSIGQGGGQRIGREITRKFRSPGFLSALKRVLKKTNHRKISREGEAQEQERREQNGGVQEARELRHGPHWDQKGPGRISRPDGEGSVLIKLQRMDSTKKGAPTGVDRYIRDIEGGKMGANEQWEEAAEAARGAGLQGSRGTWVSGQWRQDS